MLKQSFLLLLALLLPVSHIHAGLLNPDKTTSRSTAASTDAWLLSYYVGYQYDTIKPRDVDYSLMTHIVVGGVGVNADGTLNEHWHRPDGDGRAMAKEVGIRADKAGVKKLIWLGGPNEEDAFFSASSDEYRVQFVKNIIALADELSYDGVDIDWEPIRKQDEARILLLVKDLRAADPDLLITVPVNWVPTTILTTKDLSLYKNLAKYADKLFVMSYSMAGPWPGWKSWHGGALTGDTLATPGSLRTSVRAYELAGVPKKTLGIGIGTYATCWEYPIREPGQTIPSGYGSAKVHTISMNTMMDEYYLKKYERWDAKAQVSYLSFPKARGSLSCGFISYENERSVTAKMQWMKAEGLGGALVWNIGTGYLPDAPKSKRHQLLKTAYENLKR